MNNNVPVYMFTGFLESGKTTFMLSVLLDQDFNEGDKTLIIACEEGFVEFDEQLLASRNIVVEYVEDQEDFNTDLLERLNKKHQPQLVMVEMNGVWPLSEVLDNIEFPNGWALGQIVSTIDASTFENYLGNMRSIIFEQLLNSEMIIFNRCDENTKKSFLRSNIRAINRSAQIIYEMKDGSVNTLPDDKMPWDMEAEIIEIKDEDFGLWYTDALDHVDAYVGKEVRVKGKKFEPIDDEIADVAFVLGRYAMVCCADDTTPIGFLAYFAQARQLYDEEWVEIEATMDKLYDDDFETEVPILKVNNIKVVKPLEDEIVYF